MRSIKARLEKLERTVGDRGEVVLWADGGKTAEEAIAAHISAHPEHADLTILVVGWRTEGAQPQGHGK